MPWWSATRLNQKKDIHFVNCAFETCDESWGQQKGLEVALNYNSKESGVDTADQMLLDQVRLPKMAAGRGYQSWQLYHFQGAPDFQQPKTRVSFVTRWSPLPPELERKSKSHPAFKLKDEKQTPPSLSLTRNQVQSVLYNVHANKTRTRIMSIERNSSVVCVENQYTITALSDFWLLFICWSVWRVLSFLITCGQLTPLV